MYYVKIQDDCGHEIEVEVSAEVFQLFEEERKEMEHESYEYRKHRDRHGLEDYILANETANAPETLESLVFQRETFRIIKNAMRICTPTQRQRFYLHCVCGYSYKEIARLQGCTKHSIWKSVEAAKKVIKKLL